MKISLSSLREWCLESEENLMQRHGEVSETAYGKYSFIDNDSKVLAVAHLDTVFNHNWFKRNGKSQIFSPALDDRLGAYVICDLLPSLGVVTDILLTEGEEMGMSTAEYFKTDKQYNWIVEFDRRGDDVVMYSYDNGEEKEWRAMWKAYGINLGNGSFSDICSMEHLKCKAFNIGTGYYNQHTANCNADLRVTVGQVKKFIAMYEDQKDVAMPHTPSPWKSTRYSGYGLYKGYGKSYKTYQQNLYDYDDFYYRGSGAAYGSEDHKKHKQYDSTGVYREVSMNEDVYDAYTGELLEQNLSDSKLALESDWYYDAALDEWTRLHVNDVISEYMFTEDEYADADTCVRDMKKPEFFSYHTRRLIGMIHEGMIGFAKDRVIPKDSDLCKAIVKAIVDMPETNEIPSIGDGNGEFI